MKNINIDGFGANEVAQITPIMSDLFKSYVQKPKEMSLTDWLSGQLGAHLTDKTAEMTGMMSSDILYKIDAFNNNIINMQEYCAQGKTRQQWLCEQLKEVPPGMNTNTYANYVSQAESALAMGNQVIIDATQSPTGGTISLNDLNNQMIDVTPPGNMNWNNYTAAAMASNITNQANLAGLGGIMIPTGMNLALQATNGMAIPNNIKMEEVEVASNVDRGVKAVAAGALKICLEKGKIPFLRKIIPKAAVVDVACLGVESVKAIARFAQGKATAMQTVEHLRRATTSTIVNMISSGVGMAMFAGIPVVGPIIGGTLGMMVANMSQNQLGQMVSMGLQKITPIATTVFNTAKNTLVGSLNLVKNAGNKLLSFVGL